MLEKRYCKYDQKEVPKRKVLLYTKPKKSTK